LPAGAIHDHPEGWLTLTGGIALTMLTRAIVCAVLAMPLPAHAAGSDSDSPPATTKTTTECKKGEVWDEKTQKCVDAQSGRLDDDRLYQAARELAWAGRYDEALDVLAAMTEGDTDRVLTYKGFANRKAGRIAAGMEFYQAAIAMNPDNLLARSYMGQGLVEQGEFELAEAQLAEIVARGGAGGWPETALRKALETGVGFTY